MTDKLTKRFVSLDMDEIYYITDTQNLKTLNDYIQEFKKPEYEFTEKEAISAAKEEYWQMIYENSMSAKENENMLNELFEENEQLKSDKEHLMGCLIRFFGYDDEDIDYNLNRESNREYGKQYYSMKEETKKELEE